MAIVVKILLWVLFFRYLFPLLLRETVLLTYEPYEWSWTQRVIWVFVTCFAFGATANLVISQIILTFNSY